jgi:hypothetical protein
MTQLDERREAQLDALISVVGSLLAVLDIHSDSAELWPETMRNGSPEEIRKVTAELADVLPAALLRRIGA